MVKSVKESDGNREKLVGVDRLLNRKRRLKKSSEQPSTLNDGSSASTSQAISSTTDKLESSEEKMKSVLKSKAVKLIETETLRAAARAELVGSQGWRKPNSLMVNKRFLKRTLEASLSHERHGDLR